MKKISRPLESLLAQAIQDPSILDTNVLIVGSGYGGSVAAMRLANNTTRVVVLERGQAYEPGDFPYDIGDIPGHIRVIRDKHESHTDTNDNGLNSALFNLHLGDEVDALVGSGLGGTSLINANVAEEPDPEVFLKPGWPHQFRLQPGLLNPAFASVKKHLNLSKTPIRNDKLLALRKITTTINALTPHDASFHKANIAVSFSNKKNHQGVRQNPCTECGNCITGCNVGAKNTLDRNLIPLAVSRGAEFFTGANVLYVAPPNGIRTKWLVKVTPTTRVPGTVRAEEYEILADKVILSAGTLGSTEILLRSQAAGHLQLSKQLGNKFSTNGDGLIMSFAQQTEVNSIAEAEQKSPRPGHQVGPTITGLGRININETDGKHRLTIEDASIPAAVRGIFKEVIVTSAQLQRLSNRELPKLISDNDIDPLAIDPVALKHSQALLIMGDDGAKGDLSLSGYGEGSNGQIKMNFPDVRNNNALVSANQIIKSMSLGHGLNGGQYVPNPLWESLPPEAATVMSGKLPQGRAITVHPLGGCAMGDDVSTGVVDHTGNVFNAAIDATSTTYTGLYVIDAAIIPTALEINPFLTISALAWRCCDLILEADAQTESHITTVLPALNDVGEVPDYAPTFTEPVKFKIDEQLFGQLDRVSETLASRLSSVDETAAERVCNQSGLVVRVNSDQPDSDEFLSSPGKHPFNASMELTINSLSVEQIDYFRPFGVRPEHLIEPFLELSGKFTLLREDNHNVITDFFGALKNFYYYWKRRGASGLFSSASGGLLKKFLVFYNLAVLQSRRRRIVYDFKNAEGYRVYGEKVLGFSEQTRLWPALVNLDITLTDPTGSKMKGKLTVNTELLVDKGILSFEQTPNLPSSLLVSASIASYFARSGLATSFWEFGKTDAPGKPVNQKPFPRAISLVSGKTIEPKSSTLYSRMSASSSEQLPLLMTRYKNPNHPPVLLIHGLAQGSQIFWTETVEQNLASYLYEAGFDVWLVDYRLSNLILPNLSNTDWTMDEIAAYDMPAAINHVASHTNQKVNILAHCVGSCTVAMGVLSKSIAHDKIASLTANAIHPWVITSPTNRVRSRFGEFYRDWINTNMLDPIPSPDDSAFQNILDRLAFSLAKVKELSMDDHREFEPDQLSEGVCDRMSFLYGRMWNHKNISKQTHSAFTQMFGPAPAKVYSHMYHYALIKRITDHEGENKYLTVDRIRENWTFPTLFFHGEDSRVFNPYSARRSALRLNKILAVHGNRAPAITSKVFKDYGHMDVIIGDKASTDIYKTLLLFIRAQQTDAGELPITLPDPHVGYAAAGPVLRAAWVDKGAIQLRFWMELKTSIDAPQTRIMVQSGNAQMTYTGTVAPLRSRNQFKYNRHQFVDVRITDPEKPVELSFSGQAGFLPSGRPFKFDKEPWLNALREQLKDNRPKEMRFILGSCRFPGTIIDKAESDKIYSAIADRIDEDQATLLFLIGDQIYADAMDQLFAVDSLRSKYTYRYTQMLNYRDSPNFFNLSGKLPIHFVVDDHEIENNYSGLQSLSLPTRQEFIDIKKRRRVRGYATTQARFFQSATRDVRAIGSTTPASPHAYALDATESRFPVFIMDTRFERDYRDSNSAQSARLISAQQQGELFEWLDAIKAQPGPKFIVSGSTLAPIRKDYINDPTTWRQNDSWSGYPATLEAVLAFISENNIEKVVFLGGDEHLSAFAKLQVTNQDKQVTCWQVIASGLYAPLPFANSHPREFTWDSQVLMPMHTTNLAVNYSATLLSTQQSQFSQLIATENTLAISVIGSDNQPLNSVLIDLQDL